MSPESEKYLQYITTVRRYSDRTRAVYEDVIKDFEDFLAEDSGGEGNLLAGLTPQIIRSYEVHLLDTRKLSSRTANLHLSVLSGLCRYLVTSGLLKSNPVRLVTRPKTEKRLPEFYRDASMDDYFSESAHAASRDELEILRTFSTPCNADKAARTLYERRLRRLIISLLHATGIRRAELIGLNVEDCDFSRRILKVNGKGDKMREVPLVGEVADEIELYLEAAEHFFGVRSGNRQPLLLTPSGARLYPVYVDRAVKAELGGASGITGRKSPHVLRHTLATSLLNDGSDLNSIKELLGHSSLAATQVYTHNSIEKLKKVYSQAHPRAKDK